MGPTLPLHASCNVEKQGKENLRTYQEHSLDEESKHSGHKQGRGQSIPSCNDVLFSQLVCHQAACTKHHMNIDYAVHVQQCASGSPMMCHT